jgi:Mg2+ and Co2+ transporter CorA
MSRKPDLNNMKDFDRWMDEISDSYMKWVETMEKEMDLIEQYFDQEEAEAAISRQIRDLERDIWALKK